MTLICVAVFASWCLRIDADDDDRPASPQTQSDDEPEDKTLSHFMRLKLKASSKVLEGLAVEDFDLIKEGARELNKMSTQEKWRVTNDAMYRNFSGEFQRITKELVTAAGEDNLDRATLKWMDATMSCIECHRYARGIFVAFEKESLKEAFR